MKALRAGRGHIANRWPQGDKYVIDGQREAQGHFVFANVAALQWFVWANVTWGVPTGNSYVPVETEGGRLIKVVDLRPAMNTVIVSGPDETP